MIYSERIEQEPGELVIERQKNSVGGNWYAITLTYKDKDGEEVIADNEDWILDVLFLLEEKKWSAAGENLDVFWDKQEHKKLRELLREAVGLGWFDSGEDAISD